MPMRYVAYFVTRDCAWAIGIAESPDAAECAAAAAINAGVVDPLELALQGGGLEVKPELMLATATWAGAVAVPQVIKVTDDGAAILLGPRELWAEMWGKLPGLRWQVRARGNGWVAAGYGADREAINVYIGDTGARTVTVPSETALVVGRGPDLEAALHDARSAARSAVRATDALLKSTALASRPGQNPPLDP